MWIDDQVIRKHREPLHIEVFQIQDPVIVLGSGNKFDIECLPETVINEKIPVLKRYGGGGTVLLHEGCVIITIGAWMKEAFCNDRYFLAINNAVANVIEKLTETTPRIEQRGISDLAIGEKKVGGTSLFRSRNYLLYQLSLLVDAKPELMEKYLAHPSKEPEYRKNKSHKDFVAGLEDFDPVFKVDSLIETFQECFELELHNVLGDELIKPIESQFKNLEQRLKRNTGNDVIEKYLKQ